MELACAHHIPVHRTVGLLAALAGMPVSDGFMAGGRGDAAAGLDPFMERVRDLLRSAGVLYADETPARAAALLHYVHVACTGFLTAMHRRPVRRRHRRRRRAARLRRDHRA